MSYKKIPQESVADKQLQLFSVKAEMCGPTNLGGVDCNETCFCDDNHSYAVKLKNPKFAAHNEWFCANLAQRVGLRPPNYVPILHTDGNYWFGSQWIDNEIKDWWLKIKDFAELNDDWARIFAFDLFVHNEDRHLRNFFCIKEGGRHVFYILDHARAWLYNGFPPPPMPLDKKSKTVLTHRFIRNLNNANFNDKASEEILDKLSAITHLDIEKILARQPDNWLTPAKKRAIVSWWASQSGRRIAAIKLGLQNGSVF